MDHFRAKKKHFQNFVKNLSEFLSEIFHDVKLPQGLETDIALFSDKSFVSMEMGPKDQFWVQNYRFPNLLGNHLLLFF